MNDNETELSSIVEPSAIVAVVDENGGDTLMTVRAIVDRADLKYNLD